MWLSTKNALPKDFQYLQYGLSFLFLLDLGAQFDEDYSDVHRKLRLTQQDYL